MPPKALVDVKDIDLERMELRPEQIYGPILPHRHEFALLSGVIKIDAEAGFGLGLKHVRADEFWCRGHFPAWPILPGILIVEAAAQLSLVYYKFTVGKDAKGSLLFGGINGVKFREAVEPGSKLLLACAPIELKVRRSRFRCQGLVDGRVVYEGEITGILGPEAK